MGVEGETGAAVRPTVRVASPVYRLARGLRARLGVGGGVRFGVAADSHMVWTAVRWLVVSGVMLGPPWQASAMLIRAWLGLRLGLGLGSGLGSRSGSGLEIGSYP